MTHISSSSLSSSSSSSSLNPRPPPKKNNTLFFLFQVSKVLSNEQCAQPFDDFALTSAGVPYNPLSNKAGAIMAAALVRTKFSKQVQAFNSIERLLTLCTGGRSPVGFDNAVYLSEIGVSARGMALAHFMAERAPFLGRMNIRQVLELYTSACSITTSINGLAALAGTFACEGRNPVSGVQVFEPTLARDVLSLMYNCGMYDYSGRFAFEVGIPAKSSMSGAMFLSVPGKFGIAIWSPRLDSHGNSVRGLRVAEDLIQAIPSLHVFSGLQPTTN